MSSQIRSGQTHAQDLHDVRVSRSAELPEPPPNGTTIVFTNQLRTKVSATFDSSPHLPAGPQIGQWSRKESFGRRIPLVHSARGST